MLLDFGMGERTPRPKLIGVIACIACRQMVRPCLTGALEHWSTGALEHWSTGAEGRDQRIPACRGMRASSGGFTCALNRWIPGATSPLQGVFISAVLGRLAAAFILRKQPGKPKPQSSDVIYPFHLRPLWNLAATSVSTTLSRL